MSDPYNFDTFSPGRDGIEDSSSQGDGHQNASPEAVGQTASPEQSLEKRVGTFPSEPSPGKDPSPTAPATWL